MKAIKYFQRKLNKYLSSAIDARVADLLKSDIIASYEKINASLNSEIQDTCQYMIREATGYINDYDFEQMTDEISENSTHSHDNEYKIDSLNDAIEKHSNEILALKNPPTTDETPISTFKLFELRKIVADVVESEIKQYSVMTASSLKRNTNE